MSTVVLGDSGIKVKLHLNRIQSSKEMGQSAPEAYIIKELCRPH